MKIERSIDEIEDLFNRASDVAFDPSQWPGMSFEEGVMATMQWLLDATVGDPLIDE